LETIQSAANGVTTRKITLKAVLFGLFGQPDVGQQSLHRALAIANEQQSSYATLEHLLLALLDDKDVAEVIEACGADIASIRKSTSDYIKYELPAALEANPPQDGSEAQAPKRSALQKIIRRLLAPARPQVG
jgi:ATP-dependent Clp protease ATP-binding subunit ClpA